MKLYLKKLREDAEIPRAASKGDVGFDLFAVESVVLAPGKMTRVSTGIALADSFPNISYDLSVTTFLKIEGRSGLALKGVFPVGGIIDSSYRGEICPILFNTTDNPISFKHGDRCAQLVYYCCVMPESVHLIKMDEISHSSRGSGGFGSTGD